MSENVLTPSEPETVPVRIVDGVAAVGVLNGTINLTLVTNRISHDGERAKNDFVVAARLRMDLQVARFIRDQLNTQIALLEAPKDKAN